MFVTLPILTKSPVGREKQAQEGRGRREKQEEEYAKKTGQSDRKDECTKPIWILFERASVILIRWDFRPSSEQKEF